MKKSYMTITMAALVMSAMMTGQAWAAPQTATGILMEKKEGCVWVKPIDATAANAYQLSAQLPPEEISQWLVGDKLTVTFEAQKDGAHVLESAKIEESFHVLGEIVKVEAEGILVRQLDGSEVFVNVPAGTVCDGLETLLPGMPVNITYDGKMTRSIPPQATAEAVVVPVTTGVIKTVSKEELLLETDQGDVVVHLSVDTQGVSADTLKTGDTVQVITNGAMTMSLPPQCNALILIVK